MKNAEASNRIQVATCSVFVAFYAVIGNLPYWLASSEFHFVHAGCFCLQFLVVGLIALTVPPFLGGTLFLAVSLSDLLYGICQSYYLPIRECLANIFAVRSFSHVQIAVSISISAIVLVCSFFAAFLSAIKMERRSQQFAAACLIGLATVGLGSDSVSYIRETGQWPNPLRAYPPDCMNHGKAIGPRIVRISVIHLLHAAWMEGVVERREIQNAQSKRQVPSATAVALQSAAPLERRNPQDLPDIVQVVVESWGLASDASLRNALVSPYMDAEILRRYKVLQGQVPFYGSTIPAEARELCGNQIGFKLIDATAHDLESCLPSHLSNLGYYDVAVHGMNGNLFDRASWYRSIGFQERFFHEELKREGVPDCDGAFVGSCDASVAEWIGQYLAQDAVHPLFIHWMTLSSHLPVPVPSGLTGLTPCPGKSTAESQLALCSWLQLVENLHRSIVKLATKKPGRPVIFVVVGDHAPPFGSPVLRERFSQSEVPYIVLVPKTRSNPLMNKWQ